MKAVKTVPRFGSVGMWLIYGCLGAMMLTSLGSLVFLVVLCAC